MFQEELDLIVEQGLASLDSALVELKDTYNELTPYVRVPMLGGDCFIWDLIFIDNILLAYATDKLTQFSEDELIAFWNFVNFEDYHSTSALTNNCNSTAIGCTNPDSLDNSFVVCGNGHIQNGLNGSQRVICQSASYEVINEAAWKSLDEAMMSLYNCEEINDCNIDDTYEETVPCPIQ